MTQQVPAALLATGAASGNIGAGEITTAMLAANAVTTAKITDANITPAKLAQPLTLGTAQNTTSGTAIDFTSIPSWVKRITVMFNGVSTTGTANPIVQLGSGSIQTTGYTSTGGSQTSTAGFCIFGTTNTDTRIGAITITNFSGNSWVVTGSVQVSGGTTGVHTGTVTLSGAPDRLRLTTTNGTDTFDAGSVNILYE